MCSDARFGRVTIPFRGFVFFESCPKSTARFTNISALATRLSAVDLIDAPALFQFVERHSFGENIGQLSPRFGDATHIKLFGQTLDRAGKTLDIWNAQCGDVFGVLFLFLAFGLTFIGCFEG